MFGEDSFLNPPATFSIGSLQFFIYGAIIAVGFLTALAYCTRRCTQFGITQDNLVDMLLFAVPLAIVCARLYYVIFQWSEYADDLTRIFRVWEGGVALYGAVIGAVVGLVIACRWRKLSTGAMLDIGALGLLIGQIVGRWANFVNREAFGAETDVLWRMGLTDPRTNATIYVHPTFLYESMWNLLGFILLHIFTKKGKRQFDGQIFAMYVAWYGFGRMFIEGLRADSLYLLGTSIRASQLLAALSFVAAAVFLIVKLRRPYEPARLWARRAPVPALAGSPEPELLEDQDTDLDAPGVEQSITLDELPSEDGPDTEDPDEDDS